MELRNVNVNDPPYVNEDSYYITIVSGINILATTTTACSRITFTRKSNVSIDQGICCSIKYLCTSNCKTVRIPNLCILGQSILDGSAISAMTFIIFYKYEYYDEKCIV